MERLIRDKILDHMISNNFFSPFQHGSIPGKSCVTQLLETLDEITDATEQGYDVDIIYLDFCKAFDKIPHRRLMKKNLWAYGIRGKGTIIFVIFINDLPEVIQVVMTLKLIGRVKAIEHVNRIQVSLNTSVIWADLWTCSIIVKNVIICILEINLQIQNIQWRHQMGQ